MNETKKILVVDDDVDLLEQTDLILRSDGYDVVTAVGQEEAEEKLLSVHPDLCVVDLMMENMDSGFVLSHTIKRLYPEAPVIMLTAVRSSTGVDFAARSRQADAWMPADAFLDKPVRPEQLKAEVKRLLASRG
ncbi:MAG TPA: response regulator [Thermoanaerobaculaceae bacterium]|nr:response regulator [Thermoanaerobaculaceae bacterium]